MNDVWVFGMVDVSHTPALGYMQIVPDRSAATLLIIRGHLRNGTIVHSDQWSSTVKFQHYQMLDKMKLLTTPLNLSVLLESYWNRVKTKIKQMKGCHEHQLASYLDEFMYRERYGTTAHECFNSIVGDIAMHYPV